VGPLLLLLCTARPSDGWLSCRCRRARIDGWMDGRTDGMDGWIAKTSAPFPLSRFISSLLSLFVVTSCSTISTTTSVLYPTGSSGFSVCAVVVEQHLLHRHQTGVDSGSLCSSCSLRDVWCAYERGSMNQLSPFLQEM